MTSRCCEKYALWSLLRLRCARIPALRFSLVPLFSPCGLASCPSALRVCALVRCAWSFARSIVCCSLSAERSGAEQRIRGAMAACTVHTAAPPTCAERPQTTIEGRGAGERASTHTPRHSRDTGRSTDGSRVAGCVAAAADPNPRPVCPSAALGDSHSAHPFDPPDCTHTRCCDHSRLRSSRNPESDLVALSLRSHPMRRVWLRTTLAALAFLGTLASAAPTQTTPAVDDAPPQPPQEPPSYALQADPHTSRPPNDPPLVPQPPSFDHVEPVGASPLNQPPLVPQPPSFEHVEPVVGSSPLPNNPRNEAAPARFQAPPESPASPSLPTPVTPSPISPHGASSATESPSSSSNPVRALQPDDDPDRVIRTDDPHSLPIPSRMSSDHGFPEPHDPLIHVTPPPSGGWRAGQLRKQQEEQAAAAARANATQSIDGAAASSPSPSGSTSASADSHPGSNSYISPHGPSLAHRKNASQWFDPPALHGPVPKIDAASYKPSGAPQYWEPDAAHLEMLLERHVELQRKHERRRGGIGVRTTRLASLDSKHRVVEIRNNMLFVSGNPFWIQGICYSPVPIGESVSFAPKGDYFTPDFAYIWKRDLPLIKAMGATTLRIYGWAAQADHTMFLDAVEAAGLKVLVTYYLGDATQNPVWTQDQRNQIIIDFVAQVNRYRDHPAILMWSFGNELNGAWNGFAKQFSDAFTCWWQAGCAGYSDTNSDCHWQSSCMYYQLFSWINAACRAAKMVTTRPIISGFADVDYMVGPTPWLDKVARFNYLLPDMDAWSVERTRKATGRDGTAVTNVSEC